MRKFSSYTEGTNARKGLFPTFFLASHLPYLRIRSRSLKINRRTNLMFTTLERLEPNTPKPLSHILASYFQKFINYWTQTDIRFLGDLRGEMVDMPVEICVRWNGNIRGTLIVRCDDDFTKWFSRNRNVRLSDACTGKEMLD